MRTLATSGIDFSVGLTAGIAAVAGGRSSLGSCLTTRLAVATRNRHGAEGTAVTHRRELVGDYFLRTLQKEPIPTAFTRYGELDEVILGRARSLIVDRPKLNDFCIATAPTALDRSKPRPACLFRAHLTNRLFAKYTSQIGCVQKTDKMTGTCSPSMATLRH
jgi:hypothetical protein